MSWQGFDRFTKMIITIPESSATKKARIYANGRHQVTVRVGVRAVDNSGKPLSLTYWDMRSYCWLVDYETGQEIKYIYRKDKEEANEPSEEFAYEAVKNDYCNFFPEDKPMSLYYSIEDSNSEFYDSKSGFYESDGTFYFDYYVKSGVQIGKKIAFCMKINGKKYQTTADGIYKDYVHVNAEPAKKYTKNNTSFTPVEEWLGGLDWSQAVQAYRAYWTTYYLKINEGGFYIHKKEGGNDAEIYRYGWDWRFAVFRDFSGRNSATEENVKIGFNVYGKYDHHASNKVSFQKDAMCFVVVTGLLTVSTGHWERGSNRCPVTFYDQYGNKGKFTIYSNDKWYYLDYYES